jgi:hypothetical protein
MCKWFAAVHSEENLVIGPMVIRKTKPFYDGNKNKWQQNFGGQIIQNI